MDSKKNKDSKKNPPCFRGNFKQFPSEPGLYQDYMAAYQKVSCLWDTTDVEENFPDWTYIWIVNQMYPLVMLVPVRRLPGADMAAWAAHDTPYEQKNSYVSHVRNNVRIALFCAQYTLGMRPAHEGPLVALEELGTWTRERRAAEAPRTASGVVIEPPLASHKEYNTTAKIIASFNSEIDILSNFHYVSMQNMGRMKDASFNGFMTAWKTTPPTDANTEVLDDQTLAFDLPYRDPQPRVTNVPEVPKVPKVPKALTRVPKAAPKAANKKRKQTEDEDSDTNTEGGAAEGLAQLADPLPRANNKRAAAIAAVARLEAAAAAAAAEVDKHDKHAKRAEQAKLKKEQAKQARELAMEQAGEQAMEQPITVAGAVAVDVGVYIKREKP
jgi:hypothetical protein